MTDICCLDSDDCLSLDSIYGAFRCGIKEEQSWALIYQSIVSLIQYVNQSEDNYTFCEPNKLFIQSNGTIHWKSWHESSVTKNVDINQVISFIARTVYKALDYGTPDDEELMVTHDLEDVIIIMSQNDNSDEGIEENDDSDAHKILNIVKEKCFTRVLNNLDVNEHYRNVCRALVAEAIEMSTFLNQISKGTQKLKKIKNITTEEVDEMHVELWAHLWMKVMRQLRIGVSLKRVDKTELINSKQREYEMTPFEMLLNDINSKRYSLKKVSLPKHVEKDARDTILEFIRSRPPLKPVTERVLNPPPKLEPTLHQKLMDGIKQSPPLRPTPKPFERKFDSCHLPRGKRYSAFSIYTRNVAIDGTPVRVDRSDSVFQRFSFKSISLRRTASTFKVDPSLITKKEVYPEVVSPVSTPTTSRVPFWRRIFNY